MSTGEGSRSKELDQVRQLLFPDLPEEEGWARIDAAFRGAADPERTQAIERLASGDLNAELTAALRRLRETDRG
jgi:hypothetical protein